MLSLRRARRLSRGTDERGVAALLVAISFVGLLIAGAMVFDFGLARVHRTSNKLATDAAVTAGIKSLVAADSTRKPWPAACAALAYLKVNGPQLASVTGTWRTGSGGTVAGDPCAAGSPMQDLTCIPNGPASWAWYTGSAGGGQITVDIKTGYTLPDPAFPFDNMVAGDDGSAAAGGCDQLAVILGETEQPGLGGLATEDNTVTTVRSVGRVTDPVITQDVPALLLLERHNCLAIDVNGNGPYIEVKGNGAAPGSIHSDSLGDGTSCSSVNKVINGNTTIPGVLAHKAETPATGGRPGVITVAALSGVPGAVAGNASDASPSQVNAEGQPGGAPTGRGLVGRGYVDQRFLPYVRATIADATAKWSGGTPAGFTKYAGSCNSISGNIAGQSLYFSCPNAKFNNATLPNAREIVVSGALSVSSGNTLSMPAAQRLYVRGAAGIGFDVKGTLQLNDGGPTTASCEAHHLVAPTARAKLVIGQGSFTAGAGTSVRMCGTSVVMADSSGTPSCPLPTVATIPGPAPYTNGCQGTVSLGGNGTIDWSAPNATSSAPTSSDNAELEDLALWTETSSVSSIGGGGLMTVSGVFFAPNADPFKIAGTSSQSNGANAQFVARRLEVSGNGKLVMRPNPNDAVGIPQPTEYGLVR